MIVGAPQEDPDSSPPAAGRAYVFSGQDGSVLFELASPNEETSGQFGDSVSGAGDVDQDGFADVLVGAPSEDTGAGPGAGQAYVFSGQDGSVILELASPNEEEGGTFGYSVAGAGDVDRDGVADVIVGAVNEEPGAQGGCRPGPCPINAGRAYVFSGRDGNVLLQLLSPNQEERGEFGISVASAGDVNQDGSADVIVGAKQEDPGTSPVDAGRAYVFSGRDGSLLAEIVSPNEVAQAQFGSSVAGAGDVDQDGFPDLLVAAGVDHRVYVFNGRDMSLLSDLGTPEGALFFGSSAANAGDVNGDGIADQIVGAWGGLGRAFVFLSAGAFHVNSGGPKYVDTSGSLFVADRGYRAGRFGYVGGLKRTFSQPIGGTDDDPLYQEVRVVLEGTGNGAFDYRFDVAAAGRYDVALHLMAPALEGPGDIVMDVTAEGALIFDDLDVTAEAGGEYQALVKTFAMDVTDGTLDLRFRAVNKAAVVSAIAVAAQEQARNLRVRRLAGSER